MSKHLCVHAATCVPAQDAMFVHTQARSRGLSSTIQLASISCNDFQALVQYIEKKMRTSIFSKVPRSSAWCTDACTSGFCSPSSHFRAMQSKSASSFNPRTESVLEHQVGLQPSKTPIKPEDRNLVQKGVHIFLRHITEVYDTIDIWKLL